MQLLFLLVVCCHWHYRINMNTTLTAADNAMAALQHVEAAESTTPQSRMHDSLVSPPSLNAGRPAIPDDVREAAGLHDTVITGRASSKKRGASSASGGTPNTVVVQSIVEYLEWRRQSSCT